MCLGFFPPEESVESVSRAGRMKFEKFDINKVLCNGACLLGSEGTEYELDDEVQGIRKSLSLFFNSSVT